MQKEEWQMEGDIQKKNKNQLKSNKKKRLSEFHRTKIAFFFSHPKHTERLMTFEEK